MNSERQEMDNGKNTAPDNAKENAKDTAPDNAKDKREERFRSLTTAPIYPLLWRMAAPAMIGMIVSAVYGMTDTFWIGKLDRTDLTASIGVVFSLISVLQAVGFWFGYGSGNYISRQLGKRQTGEAEKMAATGVSLALGAGAVIMVLGLIFLRPLAVLLGAGVSEGLMEATVSYLRIILFSVPCMLCANVIYNQLRLQGNGRDGMVGLLVGMALNMILDPVFIMPLHMGVAGAAVASLCGQISGCAVLWYLVGKNGNVGILFSKTQLKWEYLREILAGGAPNFCRQGISSISMVLLNWAAGQYGESAIAAFSITGRVISMGYALVIGFGQGFQPICAINYGAGKYHRIRRAFQMAWLTVTCFLAAAAILISFFAIPFMGIFSGEEEVIFLGRRILQAQCAVLPFMGYYILSGMFLQNIGKFGKATLVTIGENGSFLIPTLLLFPALWGLDGLIWAKPVASGLALMLSVILTWNYISFGKEGE